MSLERIGTVSAIVVSVISLIIAGASFYVSVRPKDTKLTTKTNYEDCSSNGEKCYQLFVFNNDEAPCFEFKIHYNKEGFKQVYLMKDYEKSSIFNANFENGTISFPRRNPLPLNGLNKDDTVWLGYLGNKEVAYFSFFPISGKQINKEIRVSCIDYQKSLSF